jgi:hypothetical protein
MISIYFLLELPKPFKPKKNCFVDSGFSLKAVFNFSSSRVILPFLTGIFKFSQDDKYLFSFGIQIDKKGNMTLDEEKLKTLSI